MILSYAQPRPKKSGFTLTELAIVLGIIGLVLAAIWTAAALAYDQFKIGKATTQILTIAAKMKTFNGKLGQAGGDITNQMCKFGVFPNDMINDTTCTTITNPWNGAVTIQSIDSSTFSLSYGGIPQAACIKLLSTNGGMTMVNAGLKSVTGTRTYLYNGSPGATTNPDNVFPITPAAALATCPSDDIANQTIGSVAITGQQNSIGFTFSMN